MGSVETDHSPNKIRKRKFKPKTNSVGGMIENDSNSADEEANQIDESPEILIR